MHGLLSLSYRHNSQSWAPTLNNNRTGTGDNKTKLQTNSKTSSRHNSRYDINSAVIGRLKRKLFKEASLKLVNRQLHSNKSPKSENCANDDSAYTRKHAKQGPATQRSLQEPSQVSLSRICELKTHNSDFYNQHGRSNCTGPPLQNTRQIWKDKSNKPAVQIVPLTSLPLLFANRWVNDGNWLQSATHLKARKNLYPQTPFSLVTENGHSLRMWSERSNKKVPQ